MPYYETRLYAMEGFEKSDRAGKMYYAKLRNKKTGRINKVHFGDNSMGNFKDSTGLNAYPRLIHGDTKRRKAFRARMKGFLKPGFYSPSYFSYYFLWWYYYMTGIIVLGITFFSLLVICVIYVIKKGT